MERISHWYLFLKTFSAGFLLVLYLPAFTQGQQEGKDYVTVEVDLNSKTFKQKLPFDEAFNISGKLDKDKSIVEVDFNYRIKNRRDWHYLPTKGATAADGFLDPAPIPWKRTVADQESFTVRCGPIHPNTVYVFRFKTKKQFVLSEEEKNKLKASIAIAIIKHFETAKTIDQNSQDQLFDKILALIQAARKDPFQKIELPDGSEFDLGVQADRQKLANLFEIADLAKFKMQSFENNWKSAVLPALTHALGNGNSAQMVQGITNVLENIKNLDAKTQLVLSLPVNAALEDFKGITGSEFLIVLLRLLIDGQIDELLNGKIQLKGSSYVTATAIHEPSIMLLGSFLRKTKAIPITTATGKVHVIQALLNTLLEAYQIFLDQYEDLYVSSLDVKINMVKKVPDLTVNLMLTATYLVEDISEVELASSSTPYIGADAGLGYSYKLNNYFTYFGANFYLRPVNKRTRLSQLQGIDRILKTVSIFAGVTNSFFGTTKSDRYESTLGGNNDLILGLGVRFNRAMRINTGLQFYFLKSQNPLIDEKSLYASPVTTLTLDINVIGALGKLGQILKLTN